MKQHLDAIPVDLEKHEVVEPSAFDKAVKDMSDRLDKLKAKQTTPNSYLMVKEFMEAFGHPVYDRPTEIEDGDWLEMRLELIREELGELYEACGYDISEWEEVRPVRQMARMNIIAVADALGDLEYVVNGMALGTGIDLPEIVREVHRSNMTKLGADGKPIYREDGKILKGPGYEPPNLLKALGLT